MLSSKSLIVLFDFDGLLVHTEPLHYRAYMLMCQEHGIDLNWDFAKFCHEAHSRAGGFFDGLQREIPGIFDQGLTKAGLYADKSRLYEGLLQTEVVELMPGVAEVLAELKERGIRHAVVTNSQRVQIDTVKAKQPLLETIPLWVTREDYSKPKPDPEGYLLALEKLGHRQEKVIGFEDTLKGIKSLLGAEVEAVLVSPSDYSGINAAIELGASYWESLSWQNITNFFEE